MWERLPESLREALLPFAVARVVVAGTLGLAHFVVDRTHPSAPGVAARVHQGLLGWDAGWYETIARQGYGPLGHESLRFFPAVPLLTHVLAWVPGLGDGPASCSSPTRRRWRQRRCSTSWRGARPARAHPPVGRSGS